MGFKRRFRTELTIGEYLTPSGRSIHNIGVTPNLLLIPVTVPELKNSEVELGGQEIIATEKRFGLLSDFDTENRVNDLDELSISYFSHTPILNENADIIDNKMKIEN